MKSSKKTDTQTRDLLCLIEGKGQDLRADLEQLVRQLRAALAGCVSALDALHADDSCIREVVRAGLADRAADAVRSGAEALDASAAYCV